MRRLVRTLVVLALVAGGLAVADTVARIRTEDRIAGSVTAIPGVVGEPHVTIGGFPFLTQVSAGTLGSVGTSWASTNACCCGQRSNTTRTNVSPGDHVA